ncbi:MAG TPA: ATP-binding cassette domain-containing protein [Nitrospirae bacterium]|nr:ATP-binding cassette domain-containing protein [Nitrospirota bacterium]
MIEFRNVSHSYGGNAVLDDFSFMADYHERIAVLGGSGEGKTTILRLMLGLVKPDSGKILIDGQDITGLSESGLRAFRIKFSIVFQEGALFDSMSVRENVAFWFREYAYNNEDEIEKRVRKLLARLGIEDAIELMPEELSGGMQRRVAIARSLAASSPKMLLYDEATSGLDPLTADNICNVIRELSEGDLPDRVGFLLVTHKVTDASKVADRFIYLKNGKLTFDGELDELKRTEDPELRKFTEELHAM